MKNFFGSDKRYRNIALGIIYSILAIILGYEIITNLSKIITTVTGFIADMFRTLAPVLYGAVIAYLLYKPCLKLNDIFLKKTKFLAKKPKLAKVLSVLMVNLAALLIIALLLYTVIPNTVSSITQIASRSSEIVEPVQKYLNSLEDDELVVEALKLFNIDLNDLASSEGITKLLAIGQKILDSVGNYLITFVVDMGTFLYNFIFGFVIAIYINMESRELLNQFTKLTKAVFGGFYGKVSEVAIYADKMFFGYLTGKLISSAIIGVIAYILCLIFKVRYALLTGVVLCVTNLIPIFGPWLGAIPCVLFALMSGIRYAIIVVIIVVLMQQLDNNIIGPKIIGDKVNLSGFWILVSIIVCGKLWGLIGMVTAIPLFAVIKMVAGKAVNARLKALEDKKLAADSEDGAKTSE